MEVPAGRQLPDVHTIARLCGISDENLEAAFIGGSRSFGTSTSASDFDLTVVLNAHVGPLAPVALKRPPPLPLPLPPVHELILQKVGEHGDVDIHVISHALWRQMLCDNNVHAVTCECLPPQFVLRRANPPIPYTISLMRLKHQVYRYSHDHEQKAKTLWDKGQRPSSVKCVVHAIRAMRFGAQLVQRGVIFDLGAANATLRELLASAPSFKTWAEFVASYKSMWDKDFEDFAALVNVYKLSPVFEKQLTPAETLAGYIRGRSAAALLREVAIEICNPYPEFPELLQLHLDPVSSPTRFEFCCLSSGTVVDASRDFVPVCLPFRSFPHYDDDLYSEEKFVPQLDVATVSVYRKRHGLNAFLFSYKGKWLVASYAGLSIYAEGLCRRTGCAFPSGITTADGRQFFFSVSEISTPAIILTGARLVDGREVSPMSIAAEFGWPCVVDEKARVNIDTVQTLSQELCAADDEGYILCDAKFQRISYKSLVYRSLTAAKLTPFIPSCEERELLFFSLARHLGFDKLRIERFCALAPQLADWLMAVLNKAKPWLTRADQLYSSVPPTCSQAEFSSAIGRASPGMKRLLFEVRKDGRFSSPAAMICSPSLWGDAKLARKLYQSLADDA